MSDQELLVLGRLARPHGIKGEIRVEYNADSPLLLEKPLFLRAGNSQPRAVSVAGFRLWKDQLILRLEGVNDRSTAEMMRGQELLIRECDLPEAEPDEPYLRDIIGLSVVLADGGELVGVLEDVFFPAEQEIWSIRAPFTAPETPDSPANATPGLTADPLPHPAFGLTADFADANGVVGVASAAGHEILFPAVPEFVMDIDLDAGVIRIAPPPGLLDLYQPDTAASREETPKKKRGRSQGN